MSKIIIRKQKRVAPQKKTSRAVNEIEGKTVFFRMSGQGQDIGGVVKSITGSVAEVTLAIPNHAGVLVVAKDATVLVPVGDLQ